MGKRSNSTYVGNAAKKFESLEDSISNEYTKYCPTHNLDAVDTIALPENQDEIDAFLKNYVLERKPCKIIGVESQGSIINELGVNNICDKFPSHDILQVERKVEGGFGSGEKRLRMTFQEFMGRLKMGESELYLTTQYGGDHENSDVDHDDENEGEEEDSTAEELGSEQAFSKAADFSDTESFIMDDAHDDFDEVFSSGQYEEAQESDTDAEEEEKQGETIIAELPSGALRATEANQRVKELYQPPMNSIINILPETPSFVGGLIPQQINLWIGSTAGNQQSDDKSFLSNFDPTATNLGLGRFVPGGGSSSGLHHDHADNIYIPISGHKRFTLFSPKDAGKMYTRGVIRKVYNSGVIDYARCEKSPFWRNLRDDGAIVAEVAHFELQNNPSLADADKERLQKIVDQDERQIDAAYEQGKLDPPSFSSIVPAIIHLDKIEDGLVRDNIYNKAVEHWPLFFKANRIAVDLGPGEMLYLPTGWFHEVTSFGKQGSSTLEDQIHVAVNYWFAPPNGTTTDNLYPNKDNYWSLDYERTMTAVRASRNGP
ncbi:LADA_0F08218g1_1 [Lachancea dasiensis]|uniref:LADA_0F08218g1_1 n=1 Tax=Lachancea dasiensis TaxID=1072105 RepID=A0A1G4JKV2_9SACH|nr:LADA_0F08218g1_1 [Lachancea dasiensis]